jgi:hypothetical protein
MPAAMMIAAKQRGASGRCTGEPGVHRPVSDGQMTSQDGRPPRLLRSVGSCNCRELGFGLFVCSTVRPWLPGGSRTLEDMIVAKT